MNCFVCNYSLRGLPQEGTCPECGVAYDPVAVFIPTHPYYEFWRQACIAAVLLLATAFSFRVNWLKGVVLPKTHLIAGSIAALASVSALAITILSYRSRRTGVLLNHTGMHVVKSGSVCRSVAWDGIRCVRYRCFRGYVYFYYGENAPATKRMRWTSFGSPRLAKKCAREMSRLLPQYAKVGAPREDAVFRSASHCLPEART